MTRLRSWWWPAYAFLFPLVFLPASATDPNADFRVRVYLTLVALAGGLLLEWSAHPEARLANIFAIPKAVKNNPVPALALAYGTWTLVASLFSETPALSLTGSLFQQLDSALLTFGFTVIFALIYAQAKRDSSLVPRLSWAVVFAAGLLVVLALAEIFLARPLVHVGATPDTLPLATFPGAGHLAGFFVLAAGIALAYGYGRYLYALLMVGALALSIGLTPNRTAIAALVVGSFVGFRVPKRLLLGFVVVVGCYFAGSFLRLPNPETNTVSEKYRINDSTTLSTRLILWKAALKGTTVQPLTGWGGGQFHNHFDELVSRDDLERFLQLELGYRRLVDVVDLSSGEHGYLVETREGEETYYRFLGIKVHNQFLDVAVLYGLVGLALYLALLALVVPHLLALRPAAVGLFTYHLFLLFWFPVIQTEGVMWALWAAALVPSLGVEPVKVQAERGLEADAQVVPT